MGYDAFISYATRDKAIADAVCGVLEQERVRCWIAPRDVLPGRNYGEALLDALEGSRVLVLVLSAASNASQHVAREVEIAVNKRMIIIPFRVEDVSPSRSLLYFLSTIHWLDALTPPLERHIRSLAETIRKLVPERAGTSAGGDGETSQADEGTREGSGPGGASSNEGEKTTRRPSFLEKLRDYFTEKEVSTALPANRSVSDETVQPVASSNESEKTTRRPSFLEKLRDYFTEEEVST